MTDERRHCNLSFVGAAVGAAVALLITPGRRSAARERELAGVSP